MYIRSGTTRTRPHTNPQSHIPKFSNVMSFRVYTLKWRRMKEGEGLGIEQSRCTWRFECKITEKLKNFHLSVVRKWNENRFSFWNVSVEHVKPIDFSSSWALRYYVILSGKQNGRHFLFLTPNGIFFAGIVLRGVNCDLITFAGRRIM